jgi:hypothetical protein
MGIMSFVLAFMGFLLLVTAKNAYSIHQQVMSQTQAASASQHVTTIMRNAVGYQRFSADSGDGPFTRLKIVLPSTNLVPTTKTVALWCDAHNNREVRYFDRELTAGDFESRTIRFNEGTSLDIQSPTPTPTLRYRYIANFQIFWQSEYRVTLQTSYRYKGFAFQFSHPEYDPEGLFVTDAISKNHFMDQGVDNYALADNPTSSPAML